MYVLDSSVLIDAMHTASRYAQVMKLLPNAPIVTASIVIQEILASASEKQRFVVEQLLGSMEVLPHDQAAAERGAQAERNMGGANKIDDADMFIVGICLANDATLVTFNKAFSRVPGLKVVGI